MIKCDFGTVTIGGHKAIIKAELCTLIRGLIEREVIDNDEFDRLVDLVKNTDVYKLKALKEINKEFNKELRAVLGSFLDELFEGEEDE